MALKNRLEVGPLPRGTRSPIAEDQYGVLRDRKRLAEGRIRVKLGPLMLHAEVAALAGLAALAQVWQP
jgi:hypothetical protein